MTLSGTRSILTCLRTQISKLRCSRKLLQKISLQSRKLLLPPAKMKLQLLLRATINLLKCETRRQRKHKKGLQTLHRSQKPTLIHLSRTIPYQHSSAWLKRKIKQLRLLQRVSQLQQRKLIQVTNGKKWRRRKFQSKINAIQMSTRLRHSRVRRLKSNRRCPSQRASSSLQSQKNQKEVLFQAVLSSCQCQQIISLQSHNQLKHSQRSQSQNLKRKRKHQLTRVIWL